MPKERIVEINQFIGLQVYRDPSKADQRSARKMTNMLISDRGGLRKRQGVQLLGPYNTSAERTRGFFVFKKTDSTTEVPMKHYDDELEVYHANANTWNKLKDGYTVGSDFGFVPGFVRSGNDDYVYWGNRHEPDSRWTGVMTQLSAALVGAETSVTVDSVLRPDTYESKTATANSATTIDVAGTPWAASQWIGFYVYITAGALAGKIRKISANTSSQITFATLGAGPGNVTFEIRYPAFPDSGTLIYNNTTIAYTALEEHNKFTVGSAHAAADNTVVMIVPQEFTGNPRGNRMTVLRGRRYVANVRSGLVRNSAGTLVGSANPGSVFVSKVVNAALPSADLSDFTYSATRVAGEGDVIAGAFGGEGHRDIDVQDDEVYMFKPRSIESVVYTQDADDIAQLKQISTTYGASMRVIKGKDDVFFVTSDKQFTSLGRVRQKDAKETSLNIGLPVKRLLQGYGFDPTSKGMEFENRIHIPAKSIEADTSTNRLLIYNLNGYFEGEWYLSVDTMDVYGGSLYAAQSNSANVIKLYTGYNDILGESGNDTKAFPISSEYIHNWLNTTRAGFNQQEVNLFAVEGYILGDTTISFQLYKDYENTPFLDFDFTGSDDTVDVSFASHFMGSLPLGIEPIGGISSEVDVEGMRHFMFLVYFPFVHAEWVSYGFTNTGLNQGFEILRLGLNPTEDTIFDMANRIKQL